MNYYKNKEKLELVRKLKIGDKVKIKSRDELQKYFYRLHCGFSETMLKYAGKELYIRKINNHMNELEGAPYFSLDGNLYTWSVYLLDFGKERDIKKYSLE